MHIHKSRSQLRISKQYARYDIHPQFAITSDFLNAIRNVRIKIISRGWVISIVCDLRTQMRECDLTWNTLLNIFKARECQWALQICSMFKEIEPSISINAKQNRTEPTVHYEICFINSYRLYISQETVIHFYCICICL